MDGFGCAAVWQSTCVSRATRSGHYLTTKSHAFLANTIRYFLQSGREIKKGVFFNVPVALNRRFHSGNES